MAAETERLASCGIRTDWSGICDGPSGSVRSRELLLEVLFGAERALCGGGAALTL